MKAIKINPVQLSRDEVADFKKRSASLSDANLHINEEAYLHVNGKPVAIYKKIEDDIFLLLFSCLHLDFPTYQRTSGLVTQTININYSPRNGQRTNMCQPTNLAVKQPAIHDIFLQYGQTMNLYYKKYFKKAHTHQLIASKTGDKKIESTYMIEDTVFTGGVVNKNSSLFYHRDLANTKDGISCMVILKKHAKGGELVLPELGVSFACQDSFILLFDGQKYLHGVTPIKLLKKGYRYTVVYYNNRGMSLCLPPEQEFENFENYNIQQAIKKEENGE